MKNKKGFFRKVKAEGRLDVPAVPAPILLAGPGTGRQGARAGFTLIEMLLVMAILAILAAVVIVAINPAKQFGDAQNTQRRSDVKAILSAVQQYALDNRGALPSDEIPEGTDCAVDGASICRLGVACGGVELDILADYQKYITDIPADPTASTDEETGYFMFQNDNGRVGVCAPSAADNVVISILQ